MRDRFRLLSTLSAIVLFLVLEAASILLVTHDGVVQRLRVMGALRSAQGWVWTQTSSLSAYFRLREDNERLLAENIRLQQDLLRLQELMPIPEEDVLAADSVFTYIPAKVVRNTFDGQHNFMLLDKGADEGVESGLGVITNQGVVGVVLATSSHYSYVRSFLNAGQNVSAKLSRQDIFGPLSWSGTFPDRAVLREIPVHVEPAIGDTVSTSGYSTLYPPDIPLGTVISFEFRQGSSQDVDIKLFEDFNSVYHVYVVKNAHGNEIEQLYEQVQ